MNVYTKVAKETKVSCENESVEALKTFCHDADRDDGFSSFVDKGQHGS
jgi:hypothetical protein